MLIAHISDCHLAPEGRRTLGVAPMAENLARCVDFLAALAPAPDAVLMTGDLTHDGDAASVDLGARILGRLRAPVFLVPGNHDAPATLARRFAAPGGGFDRVVDGFPLRLIGLDSTRPGAPGGELTAAQLAWLEARLDEAPARPTVIFLHHPPLKLGVPETDEDGFLGAEALGGIVARRQQIVRIACGHVHLCASARWRGTVVATAPSPGMRLDADLTGRRESAFRLSPPALLLHLWTPGGDLVTQEAMPDGAPGPFSFAPE